MMKGDTFTSETEDADIMDDVQDDRVAMRAAGPCQGFDEPAQLLGPMVGQYEIRYPGTHGD